MSEHAELTTEKAAQPRQPAPWRLRLQRLIDVALTAAISAALTCLFLLVAALVFSLKESGSAADWLATLFNGVVAFAAVAAFFVARSWLPQLTTQEGYKLAIELVNDHYIWLGLQNNLLRNVGLPLAYIRHLQDGKTMSDSAVSYEGVMESLEQTILDHKVRLDTIDMIRFRLATYGLYEADPVRASFQALDSAYRDACDAAGQLRLILLGMNKTLNRVPGYKPDSGMMSWEPIDEILLKHRNDAQQTYEALSHHYSRMQKAHGELFNSKPTIGKLFRVRK